MQPILARTGILLLVLALAGCTASQSPPVTQRPSGASAKATGIRPPDQQPVPPDDANLEHNAEVSAKSARDARATARTKGFEAFASGVYKDPAGKYIVNGDTPIQNRKQLREWYERNVETEPTPRSMELIVANYGGVDLLWNETQKRQITYCVSSAFGARQQQVITAMAAATSAWEQYSDVKFTHVAAHDTSCTANNFNVVFDVRPVDAGGAYLARAFFPNEPRSARNVLIDESAFHLDPQGKLTLVGILRHELGHSLGLRHEQTRPESGTCFEDTDWRPVTTYDKYSVMHYPQCNGGGDWSLTLTGRDQNGIACFYGPAPGFTIDPGLISVDVSKCKSAGGAPVTGHQTTRVFNDQQVPKGQQKAYGPFTIRPGTQFEVQMTGHGANPGDPDLYVRLENAPDVANGGWNCRPYLEEADESCTLDVPSGVTKAFLTVVGYDAGRYDLAVKYTPGS